MVAVAVRRVAAVVINADRGEITCLCSPLGDEIKFGRLYVHRNLSRDEMLLLRKELQGQEWSKAQEIACRVLRMPSGSYIHCKLPA